MNKETKFAACVVLVVLVPVLMVVTYLINGFVLSKLWEWFIVTTFSLPSLPIPHAIGFALIVGFLTHQMPKQNKNDKSEWSEIIGTLVAALVGPFLTLLVGWIVYSNWIM